MKELRTILNNLPDDWVVEPSYHQVIQSNDLHVYDERDTLRGIISWDGYEEQEHTE